MKCIKVKAVFELVALIQKDIDAETGGTDSKCMLKPVFEVWLLECPDA